MSSPPRNDRPSGKASGPAEGPEIELGDRAHYEPGDILAGRYRLAKVIGEGGMGQVWLARNETLDVDVAVKLIRREVASPETAQRLLQEARAAARIGHPSIVRVFDFGESEYKDPFIVMEVLSGESLRDALERKGRLSPVHAVRTLLPVAGALAAAHAKQIVHRDLKPENIVLTNDEAGKLVPKVVDFGIAKLREEDRDGRLTKVGSALGSPDYMSPEQARGKTDIDDRSDVWALAVVLYECIAGKPPFSGPNYNALLTSIIEDPPPPLGESDEHDDALWQIVQKGLAKQRDERWPSVRAFGKALAEWALAHEVDTDIAGSSLVAHWLDEVKRPLSEPPPRPSGQFQSGQFQLQRLSSTPRISAAWSATGERGARDSGTDPRAASQGQPADAPAPRPAGSPPAPPRSRRAVVGVGAAVLAIAAGALFVARGRLPGAPSSGTRTAPLHPASAPAPSAEPIDTAASAPPYTSATAAASAPAAAPPATASAATGADAPVDWNACVLSQFAPHAFPSAEPIDQNVVCAETDPRKGATALRSRVVLASADGRPTDAMREWALLSWYEMAAFAVIRGRCCAAPPPLKLPPPIGSCKPLEQALDTLGATAGAQGDVEPAIAGVRKAIQCTVLSRGDVNYTYKGRPPDGAESAFRKTLDRRPPSRR